MEAVKVIILLVILGIALVVLVGAIRESREIMRSDPSKSPVYRMREGVQRMKRLEGGMPQCEERVSNGDHCTFSNFVGHTCMYGGVCRFKRRQCQSDISQEFGE